MGTVRIFFEQAATDDLEEIFHYIAEDNPTAADEQLKAIKEMAGRLSLYPQMGALLQDEKLRKRGYRRLVCGSYLIFYRLERDGAHIYRVLNGGRGYARLL